MIKAEDIDVKKLSLEHGDVLVVRVPRDVNPSTHGFIRSAFLAAFKDAGTNFVPSVMVVPVDMDLEVLRPTAQDNKPQ